TRRRTSSSSASPPACAWSSAASSSAYTQPAARRRSMRSDNRTPQHDRAGAGARGEVLQRVGVEDQEVGAGPLGEVPLEAEPLPGPPRGGAQRLLGGHAELAQGQHLAGDVAVS